MDLDVAVVWNGRGWVVGERKKKSRERATGDLSVSLFLSRVQLRSTRVVPTAHCLLPRDCPRARERFGESGKAIRPVPPSALR